MKAYKEPEIEVIQINVEDVIATSIVGCDEHCEYEGDRDN